MFDPFITYTHSSQKPAFFYINKGNVKVVNSHENFWVKYSEELRNQVLISNDGNNLKIDVKKDDAEIIINASQLHQCFVRLQAGIMDVDHFCAKSNMVVENGILNAHVSRLNPGEIHGHVNTGLLNNSSNFHAQQAPQHLGGWNNGWMGGFSQPMHSMFNNDITLLGHNEGHTADLHVGNGTLNLD